MAEESRTVVIDNGSDLMKAGFAGDASPHAAFPSEVRKPRDTGVMVGVARKEFYIGNEADVRSSHTLTNHYPLVRGRFQNELWREMQYMWHHTIYNELRISPEETPIFLCDSALTTKADRQKMAEIFFEQFNVPSLAVYSQPVCALASNGHTTGLVVDSGNHTTISSVVDGVLKRSSVKEFSVAGDTLTDNLQLRLIEYGYGMTTPSEREICRDIKEKMCMVCTADWEAELARYEDSDSDSDNEAGAATSAVSSASSTVTSTGLTSGAHSGGPKTYELPDGREIIIHADCVLLPEVYFRSGVPGWEETEITAPIQQLCVQSVSSVGDEKVMGSLLTTVVLNGGSTMFPNFAERLQREISSAVKLAGGLAAGVSGSEAGSSASGSPTPSSPLSSKVRVIGNPGRRYGTWNGGSVLCSTADAVSWLTKADYQEKGSLLLSKFVS